MRRVQPLFEILAGAIQRGEIHQHQVVVCAAGNQAQPLLLQFRRQRRRVFHDLLLIGLEIVAHGFLQAHGLAGDDVH